MPLKNIRAIPHPAGNQIDLSWDYTDPAQAQTICVVGREGHYPDSPFDGTICQTQVPRTSVTGLKGETVYYYMLFVACAEDVHIAKAEGQEEELDSKLLSKPLQDELKPQLAQDARLTVAESGQKWLIVERSQQRLRTIELCNKALIVRAYLFDPANRVAAMATGPYNLAGQMYDLLPTIYRRYDTQLPSGLPVTMAERVASYGQLRRFLELTGGQLDQLYSLARALPQLYDLARVDGRLLPLLADWIGWRTDFRRDFQQQRNELRAAPYIQATIGIIPTVEATVKRLTDWECRAKEFVNNVFLSNQPERLNLWLKQWDGKCWSEPTAPLSLDFAYEGRPSATQDDSGQLWLFYHTLRQGKWEICYKSYTDETGWTPSVRLPAFGQQQMNRHPTALFSDGKLHVLWDVYDMTAQRWRIVYYTREKSVWSEKKLFDDPIERRQPWIVEAVNNNMLLFWLERSAQGWQIRYCQYNGTSWGQTNDFPVNPTAALGTESHLFVLAGPDKRPWVFWSHREPTSDGQKHWQIVYRIKQENNDWSQVYQPLVPSDTDDCEPAAIVTGNNIELFWSSNRDGSGSIWHCTLADGEQHTWGTPEQLTLGAYTQRAPLPIAKGNELLLVYRSSESITYHSPTYSATTTLDTRYAGCTTVDTRNAARIVQRKQFTDFETYTYDRGPIGGPNNATWYARDTVGIYLRPSTEDSQEIERNQKLIEHFLRPFLPIQVRLVFIIEPPVVTEAVYDYKAGGHQIGEVVTSTLTSVTTERYLGAQDSYTDTMQGWTWLRAWPHRVSPLAGDPNAVTNNPLYRTRRTDIKVEEEMMEQIGIGLKGIYRDRLLRSNGQIVYDSGWVSNTIVDSCRLLLAGFIKQDPHLLVTQPRYLILRIAEGDAQWDTPKGPDVVLPDNQELIKPYDAFLQEGPQLTLKYLDKNDQVQDEPSHRLEITATLDPEKPQAAACALREFALCMRFGKPPNTTDYMLNHVRHRVIYKAETDTLVRVIRLSF
jgi:hypothetical protein